MSAARRALGPSILAVLLAIGLAAPAAAHHRPDHAGGPPDERGGPPVDEPAGPDAASRVVVAAIDSGVNAYHEFFHAGGDGPFAETAPAAVTPEVLAEFGIGPDQVLHLTRTGDQAADLTADADQWARVEPGQPYWFAGTNVIGISFDGSAPPLHPADKHPHGTGVLGSVLEANPEAVVVMVEGIEEASEEWAFTHPAVDVVTTSYGPIGSPPLPDHLSFSYTGVVQNGKVHTGAVDNTPALSPVDSTGGPWWSIGVSGYEEGDSEGRQVTSGTLPDVVGDFTQTLPYCTNCQEGRRSVSGTSFATPTTAGVVSLGILEARRAAGHAGGIVEGDEQPLLVDGEQPLTVWNLRRALEEAAAYPATAEWDPIGAIFDLFTTPVIDAAPWSTMGWGLVTADPDREVVTELLARLGVEGEPARTKSAEACDWMTAQYEVRFAYWNNYAFLGESWMTDDDPYVRC
ncbi:S8/S53 family peptidase [Nitriliruptor alkaliphilus]|uniref:S8/S53 family peptidase n=1 Tax=Nitriliruptor alkaliphilus TaxID=427918 RepID=UPI000695D561|nr:S8/S53 family peptidase [Nitriliruptor alkaliphilus]